MKHGRPEARRTRRIHRRIEQVALVAATVLFVLMFSLSYGLRDRAVSYDLAIIGLVLAGLAMIGIVVEGLRRWSHSE